MPPERLTTSFPGRNFANLGEDQAKRLLTFGFTKGARPVDTLIDRLAAAGGHEWLAEALKGPPFEDEGQPGKLLDGRASVAELTAIKERAKAQAANKDKQARLSARAAYDFAIASALAFHGKLITTQKRAELMSSLSDLGDALPEPWSGLVYKAVERVAGM
jgi:hypothetical protein